LYGVTDLSCVCRGCETATLSVDRLLGDSFATPKVTCDCLKVGLDFVSTDLPTFRQSHGTSDVLNEWPSCRSTDSVGLADATNKLEFTYAIQCIRRHVLTYTHNKRARCVVHPTVTVDNTRTTVHFNL